MGAHSAETEVPTEAWRTNRETPFFVFSGCRPGTVLCRYSSHASLLRCSYTWTLEYKQGSRLTLMLRLQTMTSTYIPHFRYHLVLGAWLQQLIWCIWAPVFIAPPLICLNVWSYFTRGQVIRVRKPISSGFRTWSEPSGSTIFNIHKIHTEYLRLSWHFSFDACQLTIVFLHSEVVLYISTLFCFLRLQ